MALVALCFSVTFPPSQDDTNVLPDKQEVTEDEISRRLAQGHRQGHAGRAGDLRHADVDGGVLRNLPIDVALELGAERVIAVDVSSKLGELKKGGSAFKVLRRTSGVMSQQRREEQIELLRDRDLLMVPDLDGVSFADFDEMEEAIERGRNIALQHEKELRAFSVPASEFESYLGAIVTR